MNICSTKILFLQTIRKSLIGTTVDQEPLESLKKELAATKLELDETKERAINLSTQLKDLEIQHIKTVWVFYV